MPLPTGPNASTALHVERFTDILAASGAREALAYVVGLSNYRFIGIFRFKNGRANAAIHYDRENPEVMSATEVPDTATYCCYVRDSKGIFTTVDASSDGRLTQHPARDAILAYCGVPILEPDGHLLGHAVPLRRGTARRRPPGPATAHASGRSPGARRPCAAVSVRDVAIMPLLGSAVMLLAFDIVPDAVAEHDEWHTHEHLPERLAIPGFVRGSRWVAPQGEPRYFVMYEVAQLATLTSDAYLTRLNNPSPWTARMMPHYRNMKRGFCSVTASFGVGLGHAARLVRFKPVPDAAASLRRWLLEDALPKLPSRRGIGSAHLLEGAATPPMTNEQRIRGADAGIDWALLVTGYERDALAELAETGLPRAQLERHGAADVLDTTYRMDYALTEREVAVPARTTHV